MKRVEMPSCSSVESLRCESSYMSLIRSSICSVFRRIPSTSLYISLRTWENSDEHLLYRELEVLLVLYALGLGKMPSSSSFIESSRCESWSYMLWDLEKFRALPLCRVCKIWKNPEILLCRKIMCEFLYEPWDLEKFRFRFDIWGSFNLTSWLIFKFSFKWLWKKKVNKETTIFEYRLRQNYHSTVRFGRGLQSLLLSVLLHEFSVTFAISSSYQPLEIMMFSCSITNVYPFNSYVSGEPSTKMERTASPHQEAEE